MANFAEEIESGGDVPLGTYVYSAKRGAPILNAEFLRSMGLDDEEIAIIMADNCPNCETPEQKQYWAEDAPAMHAPNVEPHGFDDSSPCCGALVFRGECQFCGKTVSDE